MEHLLEVVPAVRLVHGPTKKALTKSLTALHAFLERTRGQQGHPASTHARHAFLEPIPLHTRQSMQIHACHVMQEHTQKGRVQMTKTRVKYVQLGRMPLLAVMTNSQTAFRAGEATIPPARVRLIAATAMRVHQVHGRHRRGQLLCNMQAMPTRNVFGGIWPAKRRPVQELPCRNLVRQAVCQPFG